MNLYHLDRDGTLLAKHVGPSKTLKHSDEDGDSDPAGNLTLPTTLATKALNAANFDYVHRSHPAGLFVAFCVPDNKQCKARPPPPSRRSARIFQAPRGARASARTCRRAQAQARPPSAPARCGLGASRPPRPPRITSGAVLIKERHRIRCQARQPALPRAARPPRAAS